MGFCGEVGGGFVPPGGDPWIMGKLIRCEVVVGCLVFGLSRTGIKRI